MIAQIQLKNLQIYAIRRTQTLNNYPSVFGLSDSAIYTYTKQATFLRPKQQRNVLYFFQGLNTNPQNLSIFLMSQSTYFQQSNPHTKQKITKGIFNVYDIYNKWDCVIQINIPGNLKIYKIVQGKKQIVSSEQIDLMYVSSIMRSLYEKNLMWGRFYQVFKDAKDNWNQFSIFLKILMKVILKHQIYISDQFEATAQIKGSHSLTLLYRFIKQKRIVSNSILFIKNEMEKSPLLKKNPKVNIFMGQLHSLQGKYSKSIQYTIGLSKQYQNDPYILYYKAKYLYSLLMIDEAITILHYIIQYNQFQIWILLAKLHIQHRNYHQSLICLNNAAKLSKFKQLKPIQPLWKAFQEIGKIKMVANNDPIDFYVKLNVKSQSPLSIPVKLVQQKIKPILQHPSWKLNIKQRQILKITQKIYYKLDTNKFQQLLKNIFQEQKIQYNQVSFKKGLTQSMFIDTTNDNKIQNQKQMSTANINMKKKSLSSTNLDEELPHFLKQDASNYQHSIAHGDNRNLSIIPQLQSVIQNSNYEQKQPQNINSKKHKNFNKRQMNEQYFKILKALFSNDQFQKAVHQSNYAKILPVYNKLRNSSFINNFYYLQMYQIFVQTGNHNSIIVLLAEYLDFIEGKGMRKIRKLPYWLQNWIFHIIDEKGLVFLNNTLDKLNYIDEAVIQAKQNAKKWRIGGTTF